MREQPVADTVLVEIEWNHAGGAVRRRHASTSTVQSYRRLSVPAYANDGAAWRCYGGLLESILLVEK